MLEKPQSMTPHRMNAVWGEEVIPEWVSELSLQKIDS